MKHTTTQSETVKREPECTQKAERVLGPFHEEGTPNHYFRVVYREHSEVVRCQSAQLANDSANLYQRHIAES